MPLVSAAHTNALDQNNWFDWETQALGKRTIGRMRGGWMGCTRMCGFSPWNQINRNKLTSLELIYFPFSSSSYFRLQFHCHSLGKSKIESQRNWWTVAANAADIERPVTAENNAIGRVVAVVGDGKYARKSHSHVLATLDQRWTCFLCAFNIKSRAHIIQQIFFNFLHHIFAVICFIVGQSTTVCWLEIAFKVLSIVEWTKNQRFNMQ